MKNSTCLIKKLSAENVLSGVKEVTGNVANNCKSILMLGEDWCDERVNQEQNSVLE
jgi:hypothetical protein